MKDYSEILVSVIIPVYNAKNYINGTVDSVLNQMHSNVEVILVDDCSTDGTYEIEKELSEKYDNVQLVKNVNNSGSTLSRNHGLQCISGEWFMFLDADDELYNNTIEDMLSVAVSNEVDIVMCDYENIFADGHIVNNTANMEPRVYTASEIARNLFDKIPLNVLSCVGTKLYKTSFLNHKRVTPDFPRTGGDFMFIMDSLLSVPKVYYLKESLYKYYVRNQSISNSYRANMYSDLTKTRSGLPDLFAMYGLSEKKKLGLSMLRYEIIYASLAQETYVGRGYKDFRKMYDVIFNNAESKEAIKCIFVYGESIKRKIMMWMFKYPVLLYLLMRIR